MVLESLIGEKNIRKNPLLMLVITFVISIGSILIAQLVFPAHASVLSVAFITIGLVPLVHNILAKEEYQEALQRKSSTTFFARHFNLIMIYIWIFVGIILAFSLMYIAMPTDMKQTSFDEQMNAFCQISGSDSCSGGIANSISGKATSMAFNECKNPSTKNVVSCSFFIFENNFKVLVAVLLFSLLYGAGAIFIIAWNASIIGMFFGEMILVGAHGKWFGLLQGMLIGHGPPELLSYVFGALAGAILSAMVSKGQFLRHEFSTILKDVAFLTFLAVFSIIYAAVVEGVGILGFGDIYYLLGFIYVLAIILMVFFYGKRIR